jgi:DNA invertase Pin-like site-specific DNA recombinase
MKAAIYARVSTDRQTTDNQTRELRALAKREGWEVVGVFEDTMSGAKGREDRKGLDAMLKAVGRREFDAVLVWSVDRIGRSLKDLLDTLMELHSKRVRLVLHQQGLDTGTPAGKAMFQMLGVFAEFERAIIQERVKAGLARAKERGAKLGRPKTDEKTTKAVREALRAGSVREVAARFGLGVATVHRIGNAAA